MPRNDAGRIIAKVETETQGTDFMWYEGQLTQTGEPDQMPMELESAIEFYGDIVDHCNLRLRQLMVTRRVSDR